MRDSKNMTACCDEPAELTEEQSKAARRTVAQYAIDVADATDLMMMLGVHPSQDIDPTVTGLAVFHPSTPSKII